MTTTAEQVARLREHGFGMLPLLSSPSYMITGLHFYRFTRDRRFLDTVVIRADDFTIASRLPNSFNPVFPMGESRAVWSRQGELIVVINDFLERYYRGETERTQSRFQGELELLRQLTQQSKVGATNG
ncbi:hypothetical protein [Actinokineospora iranica]|uniref:Uncharacterized protein n=1 Tax=Actinokineospora iranica TaxID=1271860 RepID=A0A1G6VYM5_9PSEU|nr:hypothetical protein [Actinokineospora iranica]SDD57885.1 hypothetical protein SAMN05216174_113133 [Actinokineospora iranica]